MRLDELASSIGRQRDLSLQINEEVDVHHGLLEEMDEELDQTGTRLGQARRRLDRVAKGAKENSKYTLVLACSSVFISSVRRFYGYDWSNYPGPVDSDHRVQDMTVRL